MEIDKINWSILENLQQNARASFADIGREVGLSAPAVAERMTKMEEAGVIRGYSSFFHLRHSYGDSGSR